MKYHSEMLKELLGASPGLPRRVASWFMLPFCYLGALIGPAVLLAIPFQFFHNHQTPPFVFWGAISFIGVAAVWVLWWVANRWSRFFRQCVFHVEAAVIFVGVLAAVGLVFWIYPPK